MTLVKLSIGALGAVAIGIGVTLIAVAVGLLTWVGSDDSVMIPEIHVTTADGRIVAEDIEFLLADPRFVPDLGTATLRLRAADGSPVFAGITDSLTAGRFLEDGSHPSEQSFWLTSDHGGEATLTWDLGAGEWTFVVAGDDGIAPDQIVVAGELAAAPFRLAAATVGALGTAAAVAGGLLLTVAFGLGRTKRQPPVEPRPAPVPLAS